MLSRLRSRARTLKTDVYALYFVARDPRTPWFARLLVLLVVAYALSPIDLIPDFIPVLGYLDDLIIVPAGIALALALIPPDVIVAARERARSGFPDKRAGIVGAAVIVLIWIMAIIIFFPFIQKLLRKHP